MTTINGTVITVPQIDAPSASTMAEAAAALTNAGYSVTGSMSGNTIMASKNGVSYLFVITTTNYVTLTVDGKVVEYVAADGSFKASAASKTLDTNITGKGTGYLKNGTTYAPYTTTDTAMIAKTTGTTTEITTGYVKTAVKSGVTGVTVPGSYAKAGEKLTVTAESITANYNVTVTYTDGTKTGLTVKGSNETAGTADVKLTIVPEKDIEITAVTSAAKPALMTFTAPVDVTNEPNTGLNYTWTLDRTTAYVGETVNGTLTVTGTAKASPAPAVAMTAAMGAINWSSADAPTGADLSTLNTLKLAAGVTYNFTIHFSFEVLSGTTGTLTVSYS